MDKHYKYTKIFRIKSDIKLNEVNILQALNYYYPGIIFVNVKEIEEDKDEKQR